jgi:hypothetical protein
MYELKDIPANSPWAKSSSGTPYTVGIFDRERMVFRFRQDALRPLMSGVSFAEQCLNRLKQRHEAA